MSWLRDLARADRVSVEQAAVHLVEAEVSIGSSRWALLTRRERALVLAARREARINAKVTDLELDGQHVAAARAFAPVDGGASYARLLACAAAHGVQQEMRKARRG